MSELNVTNIKHESSSSNNLVLASDGSATINQISSSSVFPSGHVIKTSEYNIPRGTFGTAFFPTDDTIPQITEGTEIWSQSYTPTSNATSILIRVSNLFIIETSNAADGVVSAIFISGTNDAQLVMLGQRVEADNALHHGSCNGEILVPTWSGEKTISIRKGSPHHAVGYWLSSGYSTGTTMYGSSNTATVLVQEIA